MEKGISETVLVLSEAEVKKAVEDYLTYQQNLGKLMFLRLNSGELIAVAGESRRRIKLCPPGTADFVVFQATNLFLAHLGKRFKDCNPLFASRVTFIECKSSKGKQSPAQGAFEILAKMFNCRYFIVRDADELEEILE